MKYLTRVYWSNLAGGLARDYRESKILTVVCPFCAMPHPHARCGREPSHGLVHRVICTGCRRPFHATITQKRKWHLLGTKFVSSTRACP